MGLRRLLAALVVVAGLFTAIPPASAGGNSTADLTVSWSGCDVTVTFTWSGYPGSKDTAGIVFVDATTSTSSFAPPASPVTGRSGSLQAAFHANPLSTGTHSFFAQASLTSQSGPSRATNGHNVLVQETSTPEDKSCELVL